MLFNEEYPDANIYAQSLEIKDSIPYAIEEAAKLGYTIDHMAMSGGSASGYLTLLYACRGTAESPVPVRMVFEGVVPSSVYPKDWKCCGFDKNKEGAAFTRCEAAPFSSDIQKILPVVYAEVFGKLHHLVVPDGIDPGQVGGEHIDLGGFFHGFDEAEGLVQGFPSSVNAVHSPDHQPELLHLFRRGLSDGVGAAEHPGQHPHAVGEHHDALGTHLPQGMGQLLFVQLVDIVHGQGIGGMAMHHHPVCRVNGEPRHVAHHVGGKLGGEFASVLVAPQQLRGGAVGCNADDAQIGLRVLFHILKIFAGAGDDEDLSD